MPTNRDLNIEPQFELTSLIGKCFSHGGAVFQLVSLLGVGSQRIVYEARDEATGASRKVLKVFRERLPPEEVEQRQAAYLQCKQLGLPVAESELFWIDDWPVELQELIPGAITSDQILSEINRSDERAQEARHLNEIIDLCNAGKFAPALERCDEALRRLPGNSHYLQLRGVALLGLGRSPAADEAFVLCFEVAPDDTARYVAVIQVCASLGHFTWARRWAHRGARRARDIKAVYRAWFSAEERAGRVAWARMCVERLRRLGEPAPALEDLRLLLQRLEERLSTADREMEAAWSLVRQRRLDEAKRTADRLGGEHPHHVPVLWLAGVIAFERQAWEEAIALLYRAFTLRPLGNPDVLFLLGHAYLRAGRLAEAAAVHSAWQQQYSDVAAGLGRARALQAPERAVGPTATEWERRLREDGPTLLQQARSILGGYRDVAGDDPETGTRIAELMQWMERLPASLDAVARDGRRP
jgi:tetratricopeptide (TPR) repeat protein